MKAFRFKFKRLQDIRERGEDEAMLRLSLAQRDLGREEKLLNELVGMVQSSGTKLSALVREGAPGDVLRNADAFRLSAAAAADSQEMSARHAAQEVAERRGEFRRANQEAEAIRKLHERRREEHRKESLREAQKQLDEIGARSGRGGAHSRARGRAHEWRKK